MIIKLSDLKEEEVLNQLEEIGNLLDQYNRPDLANFIDGLIDRFSRNGGEVSVDIPDEETEDVELALASLRESLK